MKKIFLPAFLALIMAAVLGACNNNEPGNNDRNYFTDIVTYQSHSAQGSLFTFQQDGDSPLIELVAAQTMNPNDFEIGDRVAIQYWPQSNQQYVSGPITVLSASNIIGKGSKIIAADADTLQDWRSNAMKEYRIWRSGNYMNFIMQVDMSSHRNIKCQARLDKSTLDSEYPTIYLLYGPDDVYCELTGFLYGSYDISEVWAQNIKGINVKYTNEDGSKQTITLHKVGSSISPVQ